MSGDGGDDKKKAHRVRKSGIKAKKKKEKRTGKVEKHNPKAFTFSGGALSVQKKVQYTLNQKANKERTPVVDKNPTTPPPFVVVVHGPKGVGKSTLIRSMVKHYTRHNLPNIEGPVTCVSAKNRRLTFFEAPQDVSAQIDLAKVADLVLLMIDASFGFEMETFEFINIMQQHGFPRVIGILTHLDKFKETKQLRRVKKTMKRRFWQEIYDGAKLFYFSGLQYGRYNKTECTNLSRFISVTKRPVLSWRQNHPYVVGQRVEEEQQTEEQKDPMASRTLNIYGYVYGTRLRAGQNIHFCGVGDFPITAVSEYTDPCPAPKRDDGKDHKKSNSTALRTLQQKHRALYAPGCDVGNVKMDQDALYINLPDHKVGFTLSTENEEENELAVPEAVKMVRELQEGERQLEAPEELIIEGDKKLVRRSADVWLGQESDKDEEEQNEKLQYEDQLSDDEELMEKLNYKAAFLQQANQRFSTQKSLADLIYSTTELMEKTRTPSQSSSKWNLFEGDDDDEPEVRNVNNDVDSYRVKNLIKKDEDGVEIKWDDERKEDLKSRKFITGGVSDDEDSDDEKEKEEKEEVGEGEEPKEGDADPNKETPVPSKPLTNEEAAEFNDAMAIATYVKITIENVPALSVMSLDFPRRPIVLGGLLPGEMQMGFTQLRVKKHRWNPKILKTNDVLLASIGWRRFQTLPLFCIEDRNNARMRMLKYTPEHMHCTLTIYGPTVPPNSGALFIRDLKNVKHFRISATGNTLETAPNFQIMKKLKLVGEPLKIFKNTAYIKNMFNSDLEVNKLINAKIQTVSGVRGEIKKAEGTKGNFRASFEDKILVRDLVICKSWISVEPKKFYNPMLDVKEWKQMRTLAKIRLDKKVPIPVNKDSNYGTKVERKTRRFNKMKIPSALEAALPFKTKSKLKEKRKVTKLEKQAKIVSSKEEKEVRFLMDRLETIRKERREHKLNKRKEKVAIKEKREAFIQAKRDGNTKENRKREYVKTGKRDQAQRKRLRMEE